MDPNRRRFLGLVAAGGTFAVAGCSGGDGGDEEDDDDADETDAPSGTDDGLDDSSADDETDGDGEPTDDGTDDEPTDDGTDDEPTDDGTDDEPADDGIDDEPTDDSTDDEPTDDGIDDEPADDSDGDVDSGPAFQEAVASADSFAIDGEVVADSETNAVSYRVNGDDYSATIETTRGTQNVYRVDGTSYIATERGCSALPESTEAPTDSSDADIDVTPTGRETLDGEDVYVYEFENEAGYSQVAYVSVSTGYIRRIEVLGGEDFESATYDYSSWGEVGPIDLPEECAA
jgi:hypothetical protein